ncbi:ATP-binding protein [Streptacidiphilus jiangxiensis]|uniref:Anti-sigma regulatory factor (Ser/Thr protein kinase) n=1 Tax=Streptacidiphilus jiangxiensis TaxID=235985 RepID=A0A1H7H9A7_STRJI|nr:ATP-binding protein [Streptacidiphilus jiangxiensis]SEK46841.1 hypothetical protein SAMN05414137_102123 [Streptacidiphilus jiangxiensis]
MHFGRHSSAGDRGVPTYGRARRLELSGLDAAAAASRAFTRGTITAWGLDHPRDGSDDVDLMADALVSVSELVTNAGRHGGGARLLELVWTPPDLLRIEVFDTAPQFPALRRTQPLESVGGYGLQVVGLLCDRWGVTSRRDVVGKSVWAELEHAGPRRLP